MRAWNRLLKSLAVLLVWWGITAFAENHLLDTPRSFESERWRAGDARQRSRMIADLRRIGVLVGKSQDEVSALLGQPDREGAVVWEYDYEDRNLLLYQWRERMQVKFDEATGRVRDVDVFD